MPDEPFDALDAAILGLIEIYSGGERAVHFHPRPKGSKLMAQAPWLAYARSLIGVAEVPGPATNPTIAAWLKKLKAWWSDDATPWCGVYVAHVLQGAGLPLPRNWFRAKEWATYGKACDPCLGAIGVKDRAGGGHVFFIVGRGPGVYYALGGNQGDKVSIMPIRVADVTAIRWPLGVPPGDPLPGMTGGTLGGSEA